MLMFMFFTAGLTRIPAKFSQRILLWFWSVFCLILAIVYSGNLTAYLSVYQPNIEVDSLQDLVNNDDYNIGILSGTASQELFQVGRCHFFSGFVKFCI